jgi:hypothetical protein
MHNDTTSVFNDGVFSLSLWVKFPSTPDSYNYIFQTHKAGQTSAFQALLTTPSTTTFLEVAGASVSSTFNLGSLGDNKWHHIAIVINGSTWTAYLDGVSKTITGNTQTITTGDAQDKYWFGPNSGNDGFNGYVDEPAVFNYALSSTNVTDQYQAGVGIKYLSDALTASALMVQPSLTTTRNPNYAASPMTSSALFANAISSAFNGSLLLDEYLMSLELANYYKFDKPEMTNYGSVDDTSWFFIGSKTFHETGGPSNMPYVTADQITTTVSGGGSQPMWADTNPFSDQSWAISFWFRKNTTEATTLFEFLDDTFTPYISLGLTEDGYLTAHYESSGDPETLTGSVDLTDGQWHLVALTGAWDTGELSLYHDDSLIGTGTFSEAYVTRNRINMSGNCDYAVLVVDYEYVITESILDNIYASGTQFIQGAAYMPQNVTVSISTAFYDYLGTVASTQVKFDGSGLPEDDGFSGASWGLNGSAGDITFGHLSKNIKSYKFVDKESFYETNVSGDYSNDAFSILALFKVDPDLMLDENEDGYGTKQIIYGAPIPGIAPVILGATDTDYFAYISDSAFAHETFAYGGTLDDKWHLLGATKNGSTFKFFIDGQLIDTLTLDASIESIDGTGYGFIGGNDVGWFFQTAQPTEKYIDYVGTFNFAATEMDMFDIWQSIGVDAMEASALLELPVGLTGYGPTINPGVMYSSGLLVDPTQQDTVAPTILPMTAFGSFAHPNFAAIKTVTINATPLTASALFHMPQYDIGEINSVDAMFGSAEMGDARAYIPGFWNADPMIASTATMVHPGTTFNKGGLFRAPALTAKAQLVLPPKYKSLQDDLWYRLLFLQHSQAHGERGESNVVSASAFLKLFDDVTQDIGGANTNKITNNLPWRIVVDSPTDTTETITYAYASNQFVTALNTPILEVGYFDDYQRKAVRFNNTQFRINENVNNSMFRDYSLEFTFKSTKSNQIIAQGEWNSFLYSGRRKEAIGLVDGKLYGLQSFTTQQILHPKNPSLKDIEGRVVGNKRIDDGQWHHVVIQYGLDGRTQFWIDGKLDIQLFADQFNTGVNIRPFILGYNSKDDAYQSDFYTSAWSYDAARFISQQDIVIHNAASFNYEPIKAEPMTNASADMGQNTVASGNRGRALMLYWWPTSTGQATNQIWNQFDKGYKRETFDVSTFDTTLETLDYIETPPQEYFGWDVFPVDVTGLYVSDLVKPAAYGGEQNIVTRELSGNNTYGTQRYAFNKVKVNRRGWFRDEITDDRRYIDLVHDIDLSQFDAIFFKNFPDQSAELDEFTKDQVVDAYFGSTEKILYEQFIKSLRAAVDTGISLFVTNTQLALDLGIIDRVEVVSDLDDVITVGFGETDVYTPTILPSEAAILPIFGQAYYHDTYKNNRLRIVNTYPGITDEPTIAYTGAALWTNDDRINFGGADRPFHKYEYKPNGFAVGDEFILADTTYNESRKYEAVPFANVKAGTIITAFAEKYRKGLDLVDNPYKDYATTIVLSPGDVLNGKPVGGKIFVQFTERDIHNTPNQGQAELITDFWINFAYAQESITLEQRNTYLNASYNLDRKLEAGTITQQEYNKQAFWSVNGMHVLQQADQQLEIIDASSKAIAQGPGKTDLKKFNGKGQIVNSKQTYTTTQFFTFKYSWQYPMLTLEVPSMNTRGFWWLSGRTLDEGTVYRTSGTTVLATLPMPAIVVDKIISVNAAPMIVVANMTQPTNYAGGSVKIAPLPFQAFATITQWVINQVVEPMTATAQLRTNIKALTSSIDEVILYVNYEEPILYIRKDVTK